jgi:hypothetical protein
VCGDSDHLGVMPRVQEERVSPMTLLESGIPLSLLLDLVCGPQSADLLEHEHATSEWEPCPWTA